MIHKDINFCGKNCESYMDVSKFLKDWKQLSFRDTQTTTFSATWNSLAFRFQANTNTFIFIDFKHLQSNWKEETLGHFLWYEQLGSTSKL